MSRPARAAARLERAWTMERAIENFKFWSVMWTALSIITFLLGLINKSTMLGIRFDTTLIIAVVYRIAAEILTALDHTRDKV